REIVKSKKLIAVADCLCRIQQKLVGKGCDKPLEVCLMFGANAQYFLDREMARRISVDEALKILDISEEAGLVPQPTNDRNPSAICNCCGCCCGILRALKKHPHPAHIVVSNYYAVVDPDECTGCETCLERCQMEAFSIGEDDIAVVDLDRCIGCGLCVTTCPTEAIHLELKSEDQRLVPPERAKQTMVQIAKKRGTSLIPIALSK
ncbi:MAG: ferredoxin family protein, partial [Thermodesulfobacteriota bacterium]|nr:ferredoxin family protein [Thermodesulfobacteriota bacterium]